MNGDTCGWHTNHRSSICMQSLMFNIDCGLNISDTLENIALFCELIFHLQFIAVSVLLFSRSSVVFWCLLHNYIVDIEYWTIGSYFEDDIFKCFFIIACQCKAIWYYFSTFLITEYVKPDLCCRCSLAKFMLTATFVFLARPVCFFMTEDNHFFSCHIAKSSWTRFNGQVVLLLSVSFDSGLTRANK